eukprot:scaffold112279_cov59-Phaeocystis_antarctica.AAC.2
MMPNAVRTRPRLDTCCGRLAAPPSPTLEGRAAGGARASTAAAACSTTTEHRVTAWVRWLCAPLLSATLEPPVVAPPPPRSASAAESERRARSHEDDIDERTRCVGEVIN